MKLTIPDFSNKKEMLDFLVANKEILMTQKKSVIKYADSVDSPTFLAYEGIEVISKNEVLSENADEIQVKAVINTTNILDSHGDVHIKGLWNKSLKENKRIMHIQEHDSSSFNKIIASGEDLQASVKTMTWKSLGYDMEGSTQALIFDSNVKLSRNPFMFSQYKSGFVNNHSVGMRYVKMELAVNDKDYEKEKSIFDKYIPEVVNRKEAEDAGFFWVVTEAKVIEGSAVPLGSNPITPTINVKNEPSILDMIEKVDTQRKAADSTFDILNAIKNY